MPTTIPTPSKFKARAEAAFRKGNPDAVLVGYSFTWTREPEPVTWADRSRGLCGNVRVASPGHRTTDMVASFHDGQVGIR